MDDTSDRADSSPCLKTVAFSAELVTFSLFYPGTAIFFSAKNKKEV